MTVQDEDSSHSKGASGFDSFLADTSYMPETIEEAMGSTGESSSPVTPPMAPPGTVPPELIAQAIGPSFQALFRAIATARGKHWELQEFEKNALVSGWTPMLQLLLARLGSSEQVMLGLALTSTVAIVGGKIAQEATLRASSMASTKTQKSADSSASSANADQEKQPAPSNSWGPDGE